MKIQQVVEQLKNTPEKRDLLILNKVMEMVEREDSKQTIFDTVSFLDHMHLFYQGLPQEGTHD
jgi:hypothetical protein